MSRISKNASRNREGWYATGAVLAFLAVWELVSRLGVVNPETVPAPSVVAASAWELMVDGTMWSHLGVTLQYVLAASAGALVIGVALGVLLSSSAIVRKISDPFLTFFLSIPKSLFLPIFILLTGIGASQKILFGIFMAVAVVIISTMAGLQSVDRILIQMARSLGISRRKMFTSVYLRSMTSTLLEAVRLAIILAITGVLLAEMYVSRVGMGNLIRSYSNSFQIPELIAAIAFMAVIGIVLNEVIRGLERRQSRWKEGAAL